MKELFENEENKAKFKEEFGYDLEVPTTWAKYIDAAKFFNGWDWDGDGEIEYGTIEAMAPKDVGGYIFLTHAITYAAHPDYPGYAFFNPETMEPMVNNPAYERALNEYTELLQYGPPNMINYGGGDERAAFPAPRSRRTLDTPSLRDPMNAGTPRLSSGIPSKKCSMHPTSHLVVGLPPSLLPARILR